MGIPIGEVLGAPALGGARLIAGAKGIGREVFWTSVIEWQAVGFIRPGELVLTTGVGLDEARLTEFLSQIVESEAAALCVSLPPSGPVSEVPAAVLELADRRAVPVIELPWEVGFADVSRWAVDELIQRRFESSIDAPDRVYARFADALLGGEGMDGIAAALEAALGRPVLVFDARVQLVGHGPLAESALGAELAATRRRAAELSAEEARVITERLAVDEPRRLSDPTPLGLGPGTARAAVARHDTLGFLYVLDDRGSVQHGVLPSLELRAIDQAAAAVAIEALRRRSSADERTREDFLWQIVTGAAGPPDRILARAALLGFDARVGYELAVARSVTADDGGRPRRAVLERVARELRQRAAHTALQVSLVVREQTMLVLAAHAADRPGALRRLVVGLHAEAEPERRASWGLASAARPLTALDVSYGEADRALEVGSTLVGPGTVADAADLAPYMMLARLGADPQAMAIARRAIEPLLEYDRARKRNLLETLDVYLQETCNASAAARRLFLNRHSLAYRLRKIEELTGRALDQPADRFVLDLSIKLLRFGIMDTAER